MFIPRTDTYPRTTACCTWCCDSGRRSCMYRLRDGPGDFWFCNDSCAGKWVLNRHKPDTYQLLKLDCAGRRALLSGQSIDEYIAKLRGV